MKKTKLAIFDLDGTLYDTNYVNYLAYKNALPEVPEYFTYDFFANECNGKSYKDFLPGLMGSNEKEEIKRVHQKKKEGYKTYLAHALENKHLFSIIESISSEYHIALVTTASRENVEDILKHFQRRNRFELIVTNEDVQYSKPNPEGFLKAMKYFEVSKENTIIFEDSTTGVEAAERAGAMFFVTRNFDRIR